ncbi:MAG: hypothetical protein JWN03_3975 [Nocardia sp.]|nr:hypothetical protein [Nocardia sp.]
MHVGSITNGIHCQTDHPKFVARPVLDRVERGSEAEERREGRTGQQGHEPARSEAEGKLDTAPAGAKRRQIKHSIV